MYAARLLTVARVWRWPALALLLGVPSTAAADVKLPAIFSDHMVLQRDLQNPVWGSADAGEAVTVTIADQKHQTKANADGKWRVKLDPLPAGGPHELSIAGSNTVKLEDVLVGEVWICSGQSNMGMPVERCIDADLEIKSANYPRIRLISVPQVGTQEPQSDFEGKWELCSPATVGGFSGVGYFFGRQLYNTLDVPIGLIDDAWGGSACEAWIPRDVLEKAGKYQTMLDQWDNTAKNYDHAKAQAAYEKQKAAWLEKAKEARKAGKPMPQAPRPPQNPLTGNHRPANIYNGVLLPTIGYGIRGTVWYQGESNAPRAYEYRDLFPLMIKTWREKWGQGDFPFYFVQLADYKAEKSEPSDSDWAELREAQTMTMSKLPNTGQAVIVDLGEANDIHPRNKQEVGMRLARWALARDYDIDVPYRSPTYKSMETKDDKVILSFESVGKGLRTVDVADVRGFTIAGEDKKFYPAEAKILGPNEIMVRSNEVSKPVAVRYAWADNPVCNVTSQEGLPLTPFRTDTWPGITSPEAAATAAK